MELSIQNRIYNIYDDLGDQSKKIADFILKAPEVFSSLTLEQLAEKSGVSTATISRFANQLGYSRFSQLKWSILNETNNKDVKPIKVNDSAMVVAKKTLDANIETLNRTFELMSEEQLQKALQLIVHAQNLDFFGLGGSNIVALDAYHKFLRVPIKVMHDNEYHLALMQASKLTNKDCAVVISHTGNDQDTLLIAETLKRRKVPMIVITSFPDSPLANYGEICFFSISEDSEYRTEALLSLTTQLAINDCLYMLAAQHFGSQAENILKDIRQTIIKKH